MEDFQPPRVTNLKFLLQSSTKNSKQHLLLRKQFLSNIHVSSVLFTTSSDVNAHRGVKPEKQQSELNQLFAQLKGSSSQSGFVGLLREGIGRSAGHTAPNYFLV